MCVGDTDDMCHDMCGSQRTIPLISFYYMDPGYQTRVLNLVGKC